MRDSKLEEQLIRLGLTTNQAKVYVELSKRIDSTALAISKSISVPRTSVYLELERLEKKSFVISTKVNGTTRYKISPPTALQRKLQSEMDSLLDTYKGLDSFIKQIDENQKALHEIYSVNIYKRQEGIKQLLWNILTSGSKLLVGFSPGTLEDVVDHEFAEEWRLEFKRRNMHNKIILNEVVPLNWSNINGFLDENVDAKTLNKEKIRFEREVLIYDDTMAVISKKNDPEQYGIEIKDKLLVASYTQIFDFLWKNIATPFK